MEQEITNKIDLTPLFLELFRTRANIKAFAKVSLSEEDYKRFEMDSKKELQNVADEFAKTFPNLMKGYSEALKNQE